MSWLSEWLWGGSDNSAIVAAQQAADAQRLAAEQDAQRQRDEAARRDEEQRRREEEQRQAYEQQLSALQAQFAPTELDTRLQQQQVQQLDTEAQRNQLRQEALARVSGTFAPEFERTAVPTTLDDPYIAQAYASERGKVDEYLNNLLRRGVITQTGYAGGERAAGEQEAGVRAQLSDVGEQLLEAQRGKLTDIANRARGTASTLDIGQTFDPSVYSQELGTASDEFTKNLGDLYAARAPKGLFDLSSLATSAGAAQGAQNLAFDPTAVAGGPTTEPTLPTPPRRRQPSAVF